MYAAGAARQGLPAGQGQSSCRCACHDSSKFQLLPWHELLAGLRGCCVSIASAFVHAAAVRPLLTAPFAALVDAASKLHLQRLALCL